MTFCLKLQKISFSLIVKILYIIPFLLELMFLFHIPHRILSYCIIFLCLKVFY